MAAEYISGHELGYNRKQGNEVINMENACLLNVLFAEYYNECCNRTMRIEDIKAIERVKELLSCELPERERTIENGMDSM